jgi:1-acyl-sn-glycerol-3-phosphate acyltransferase
METELKPLLTRISNLQLNNLQNEDNIQIEIEKRKLWYQLQCFKEDFGAENIPDLENYEKKLHFNSPKSSVSLYDIIKFIGLILGLFIMFPFMVVLSLLRLLTPILRNSGMIKNNYFPNDYVQKVFGKILLIIGGIHVNVEGENVLGDVLSKGETNLGFFQHSSNLDPFIILGESPLYYKYIAKKSLIYVPVIGLLSILHGTFIPIDRNNIQAAIGSLKKALDVIKNSGRNIAISPEGTRSVFGQLSDFKKGPFHLAMEAKVLITPIIIYGAYNLWPRGQKFPSSGSVTLRFLKPIPPQEYAHLPFAECQKKIRKIMLEAMADYPQSKTSAPLSFKFLHYTLLGAVYMISYVTVNYLINLF